MADGKPTQAFPARPYSDPTRAWVVGSLQGGVDNPDYLVDEGWEPEQKRRWSAQFNALAAQIKDQQATRDESAARARARGAVIKATEPPVLRDIASGVAQGVGDIASLGLRAVDATVGEGGFADTLNRGLAEHEQAYAAATTTAPVLGTLQTGVRGAARSVTSAAALAPLGPTGIISGFAASRANQASTEADDAGLSGMKKWGYVGRAAAIEGGVAGAFQALGMGAFETMMASGAGLTKQGTREILKNVGYELVEENVTEFLDAYNQAESKVAEPLTTGQKWDLFKQTTVQTLLTMGFSGGVRHLDGRANRAEFAEGLAGTYGWTTDAARGVVERAADGKAEEWETNLGREVQEEGRLTPSGLLDFLQRNELGARTLAQSNGSRKAWKAAGLQDRDESRRAEVIEDLREIISAYDEAVSQRAAAQAGQAPPVAPAAPPAPTSPGLNGMRDAPLEQPVGPLPRPGGELTETPRPPKPEDADPLPTDDAGELEVNFDDFKPASDEEQAERAELIAGLTAPEFGSPPSWSNLPGWRIGEEIAAGKIPPGELSLAANLRHKIEEDAIKPGSTDWRTADVETLRGIAEGFTLPEAERAQAQGRLDVLENPVPEDADWKTADSPTLTNMLAVGAVPAADRDAAIARLTGLMQERLEAVEQAAAPPAEDPDEDKPLVQPTAAEIAVAGRAGNAAEDRKNTGLKTPPPSDAAPGPEAEATIPPVAPAKGPGAAEAPPVEPIKGPKPAEEDRRKKLARILAGERVLVTDEDLDAWAGTDDMNLIASEPNPGRMGTKDPKWVAFLKDEPTRFETQAPPPPPAQRDKHAATLDLVAALTSHLREPGVSLDWRRLQDMANTAYGGTLASQSWEMQDAYEALELATNRLWAADANGEVGIDEARLWIGRMEQFLGRLPTQTTRSDSKIEMQQFSTPVHYAYAATWIGAPRQGEVVIEPSAGTGSLVVHAKASGAMVIANEYDDRRADLVATVADEVYREDAEQLSNIVAPKLKRKPTLVLMNPPFSAAGKRAPGKKLLMTGAKHIESALATLEDGGRLVAIVGRGMTQDSATFAEWWDKIGGLYDVRANVGVSGDVYTKNGTAFATRLLVIDKVTPSEGRKPVLGEVETITALIDMLEGVKSDRPGSADRSTVGESPVGPRGPVGGVAPGGAPPVDPDVGVGGTEGQPGATGAAAGVRGADAPGNVGGRSGGVSPGGRSGGRSGQRPGRATDASPGPSSRANAGAGAGLPGVATAATEAVETAGLEVKAADTVSGEDQGTYETYRPSVAVAGAQPHPTPLVESAAMASVDAPKVTYSPKLPKKLIEDGVISGAQLEPVIYAGAAHQQSIPMPEAERAEFFKLTGREAPMEKTRGYFIGDGTGVGKGREASAIIMDNRNQGRRKAIWISEGKKLFQATIRDWAALGGKKEDILGLHQVKAGDRVKHGDGILFGTYTTIGKAAGVKGEKDEDRERLSRVEQITEWAGPDFDGVLIFDESHNAANAVEAKGARGNKKPSNMALMTLELQRRLPKARVVYMSATGATQVSNFAYADRLGLWGEGTEFADRAAFINGVAAGGVAAMELVARDMKSQGMYSSRTLSFQGVDYSRLTHTLDADQIAMYDALCEAWQVVLKDISAALLLTSGADGKVDGKQKSQALSRFWSAHQGFFNQVLTALQMPSVITALKEDLAAGKAPVIQIVNTMAAATDRALKKAKADAADAGEDEDLDDIDLTPRDALVGMVSNAFPITQMEQVAKEGGGTRSQVVTDSAGKPVYNQQALAMKAALLRRLEDVRVPDAPIDQIIATFGATKVAEVTGRSTRVVRGKDGRRVEQKRTTNNVLDDIRAFMDGQRDLLVFSQAGATGESYHADNTKKNKKQRVHYVLQAGWRADKAVQGLGRSHRSNQATTPLFKLVETNLPGHRRFISTIAKRLEQLGALSRGQRTAGGGGLFSETDNLEGSHAQDALYHLLVDVINGRAPGVDVHEFEAQTGLKLLGDEGSASPARSIEVRQFLNRLLSLKVDFQNVVFDAYAKRLEARIESARQNGTLDVGMETIEATKIEKVSEKVVRTDARTGSETKHVELKVFQPAERWTFDEVMQHAERMRGRDDAPLRYELVRNGKSQQAYVVFQAGTETNEKGKIENVYARWGPSGKRILRSTELHAQHVRAYEDEVKAEWAERLASMKPLVESRLHLITGTLLPVWNRLDSSRPRVRRATTTDTGERFLGRVVDEDDIQEVLGKLGVEHKLDVPAAKDAEAFLLDGGQLEFGNGWILKSRKVRDERMLEVMGLKAYGDGQLLTDMGAQRTTIANKPRYFFPTGPKFVASYERLVRSYDVVRVVRGAGEARAFAPADSEDDPPGGGGGLRRAPGGAAPATGGAGAPRNVQAVEVIKKIESLYRGLRFRGPSSFRREFKIMKARGWYTPALGEVRMRQDAFDVVTAIHELGHHLDRELGDWSRDKGGLPSGVEGELQQLGEDLYLPTGQKPAGGESGYRAEGFAEFIREYLSGHADLVTRAPNTYRWFTTEHLVENHKEAAKFLELGRLVQAFLVQDPQQAIEALMRPTQTDWSVGRIAAIVAGTVLGGVTGAAAGGVPGSVAAAAAGAKIAADPNAEANWRDSNLPLLRGMQETGADLSRLEPKHNPYILATFYARSAGGRARHTALSKTVDLHGRETGAGLRDVLSVITDQGEQAFQDWKEFMVALRALTRYRGLTEPEARALGIDPAFATEAGGINPGISRADAEAIVKKHQARPGFQRTAAAFRDFATRVMEPLVQSGHMTMAEFMDVLDANPIYVPFLRRAPSEASGSGGSGGRAVHGVTKAGSNLPIVDPIDAMLMQVERVQQVAMQADVVRSMVHFHDSHMRRGARVPFLGSLLVELPSETEGVSFSAAQVRKAVLEDPRDRLQRRIDEAVARQDADAAMALRGKLAALTEKLAKNPPVGTDKVEEALSEFWDEQLTIFRPRKQTPNGGYGEDPVISVVVNGKRRHFQVRPELEQILEGVTQSQFLPGQIGALVRGATQLQRLGATGLNPAFGLIRNALRDTLTASVSGDYHFHVPILSTMRGVLMDIASSDYASRYHAAGLDIGGRIGQDVEAASELSALFRPDGMLRGVARKVLPGYADAQVGINGLRDLLSHSEVGPRLMEFQAAYDANMEKWGGDEANATIVAGCAAKDVTVNFARAGNWARSANEVILFFNAAIQSPDKLMRTFGVLEAAPWASSQDRVYNAARATAKAASFLTSVALVLYFMNKDDEWWKKLPPHEKWGFLHYRTPWGYVIRVPLPFEAGSVFGSLPIAMIEESTTPGSLSEAFKVALKGTGPIDIDGLHGLARNFALLSPMVDVLHNKDWKGAPIVPASVEENRLPEDQFGPRTTGLARLVGSTIGMSPAKLEHLLDGYTGGLYRRLAGAWDTLTDPSNVRPGEDPSTIPVAGTLFLRPGTSRVVTDFYDRLKHLRARNGSRVASLEETAELGAMERLNRDLQKLWEKRRADVAGEKRTAAAVQREASEIQAAAELKIGEHNRRDTSNARQAGLGATLYRLTDPSDSAEFEVPAGVTEAEAVAALRAEAQRRARARGTRNGARVRDDQGDLTAFGARQARLLRRIRNNPR